MTRQPLVIHENTRSAVFKGSISSLGQEPQHYAPSCPLEVNDKTRTILVFRVTLRPDVSTFVRSVQ